MTLAKICGIRTVAEGTAALQAGADWLGFVLWPSSKRATSLQAATIVIHELRHRFQGWSAVGVFVDPSADEVAVAVSECGFQIVQLSGNEPPELVRALPFHTLKALHVSPGDEARAAEIVEADTYGADCYLLDTHAHGEFGGTGKVFDWERLRPIGPRCIAAGGLTPDNVAAAMRTLRPLGVDVSSGVEHPQGGKDPRRMHEFLEAVRIHDAHNRIN